MGCKQKVPMPELNADDQSLWATPGAAAVFAIAAGASVDSLRIAPGEIGVVSLGSSGRRNASLRC